MEVSSYFVTASRTLIDPMRPDGRDVDPERIVLTTRHHLRDSESYGVPILCHESGLHEFEGGPDVQGFAWGDELAARVTALKVDAICDEETALRIDLGDGFLAVADAVMRYRPELHFVPSEHLGENPRAVKQAIRDAYRALLDEPFESLLLAHGDPLLGDGREALRKFVEQD
jgi:hypothetical protein